MFDSPSQQGSANDRYQYAGSIREVLDRSGISTLWVEPYSGKILDANQTFRHLFGLTANEPPNCFLWQVIAEFQPSDFSPGRSPSSLSRRETVLVTPKGLEIPVEITGGISRVDGANKVMVLMITDISARKAQAEELSQLARRFEAVISVSGHGIWDIDFSNDEVTLSHKAAEIIGLPSLTKHISLSEVIAMAELAMADSPALTLLKDLRSGNIRDFHSREFKLINARGENIWIEASGRLVARDDRGQPVKFLGSVEDITARKLNEQQLVIAEENAKQASKEKSQFVANMSHELRTPLNAVLGFLSLLEDEDDQHERRMYTEQAKDGANHLLALITDILDFSKIESGNLDLELRPVSPTYLVEQVIAILRHQAASKNLALNLLIPAALPKYVVADSTRLSQILLNLVGNAIKYTHKGSVTLEVSAHSCAEDEHDQTQRRFRFTITDTGIGLNETQKSQVLQPFAQVDGSRTRAFEGVGLGLAITTRLLDAMGSELQIDSVRGEGSVFSFDLQLTELEEAPSSLLPIGQKNQDGGSRPKSLLGLRILAVEDNKLNQKLITQLLAKLGAKADLAVNGEEAVKVLTTHPKLYDCVLMDIQMPVMDGISATEQIRAVETLQAIPIIAMSANALVSDKQQALDAGMNDFVTKPIQADLLTGTILKYCASNVSHVSESVASGITKHDRSETLRTMQQRAATDREAYLSEAHSLVRDYESIIEGLNTLLGEPTRHAQWSKTVISRLEEKTHRLGANEMRQALINIKRSIEIGSDGIPRKDVTALYRSFSVTLEMLEILFQTVEAEQKADQPD